MIFQTTDLLNNFPVFKTLIAAKIASVIKTELDLLSWEHLNPLHKEN